MSLIREFFLKKLPASYPFAYEASPCVLVADGKGKTVNARTGEVALFLSDIEEFLAGSGRYSPKFCTDLSPVA